MKRTIDCELKEDFLDKLADLYIERARKQVEEKRVKTTKKERKAA